MSDYLGKRESELLAERRRLLDIHYERLMNRKEKTRLRNIRRSLDRIDMRRSKAWYHQKQREILETMRWAYSL